MREQYGGKNVANVSLKSLLLVDASFTANIAGVASTTPMQQFAVGCRTVNLRAGGPEQEQNRMGFIEDGESVADLGAFGRGLMMLVEVCHR